MVDDNATRTHAHGTKQRLLTDAAEAALRTSAGPLGLQELSAAIADALGASVTRGQLNGALHDDQTGRFVRSGRGRWDLNAPRAWR